MQQWLIFSTAVAVFGSEQADAANRTAQGFQFNASIAWQGIRDLQNIQSQWIEQVLV